MKLCAIYETIIIGWEEFTIQEGDQEDLSSYALLSGISNCR